METALLILAIWFAIAGAAIWIDRRLAQRLGSLTFRLEAPDTPAELEPSAPPAPAVRCGARSGSLPCVLAMDHAGAHESRTGVSWNP